jgi:hypothetical protein
MKKYIFWLLVCFTPFLGFTQQNKLSKGIRIAFGMSNLHDQKLNSFLGYKPNYSFDLFVVDDLKRDYKLRVEMGFNNKGTKQLPLDITINLNYISAKQLFGKYFPKTKTYIYAGVYESYLLNPEFDLGYNSFHFTFNVLDFGLSLRPSIVLMKKPRFSLIMDFDTSYSLSSIYDNTSHLVLTTPESAWTRNICFDLGLNFIIAPLH